MSSYDDVGKLRSLVEQVSELTQTRRDIRKHSVPEPDDSAKMATYLAVVERTLKEWETWRADLETSQDQGQRPAICKAHIDFLEDCKIRYTSETHNVHSDEFRRYVGLVGKVPTGMYEPWKVVQLVEMGEKEVGILRLIHKECPPISTAHIVAPHSNPESSYWVHYPSKTVGGDTVRPIHLLGEKARETAISKLGSYLEYLAIVRDEREKTKGIVGANDDGPIEIVENPAKPDTVTPLEPCTVDEFFEKLGYLSIEEDEGKQGRVVAIADTKWDERLYPSFNKIFNNPPPVVFTHGNLVPENILCNTDGSICEIIGWERAGYLPQGWEGAAALRDRGPTNASWHGMGTRAVRVLDRSRALGDAQPTCDLWKLENARLNGRLAPHSWYDKFASPTRHCKDQTQSIRRIRECPEKSRAQGGDEGLIASDGEVPAV